MGNDGRARRRLRIAATLLVGFISCGGLALWASWLRAEEGTMVRPTSSASTPTAPGAWYRPPQDVTWRWQLTGTVDPQARYDLHDLDLFDTPERTVATIRARGEHAVCYLSAGSWEDWRPDAAAFPEVVRGRPLDGWPGERWLDIRRLDLLGPAIGARLDLCKAKGFAAVEPDNIDGYANESGFPLTAADQLAYNRWLAEQAHARGLGIALKNDAEQVAELVAVFDFAIVEECFTYDECAAYLPFIASGKAVLAVEYRDDSPEFCAQARQLGFRALLKRRDLDAWARLCWP
jgi:hypothetical protein